MPIIETRSLTKHYGEKAAIRNVEIKIDKGDFIAVVGPSGSGKTTLLRLLDLLEEPSEGRIFFDGIDTASSENDRLRVRRRIGMVFQQGVMFSTSVYDNVAYPLQIRDSTTDLDRRVRDVLELVSLAGFEERRATTLSGGEMQRVSLAQALVFEPELLLLDEPTANLDPKNAVMIEQAVARINRERKVTVVMSTHNMFQAEKLASRAAVLREGELVEIGNVGEILKKPSDFLAGFAKLQNVYSGRAKPIEPGLASVEIGGNVEIIAATEREGDLTLFIRPQEIIVSTGPMQSSARNMLKGRIVEVVDLNHLVQIKADVGRELTATLTRRSYEEMKLTLGSQVYLSFKASSIQLI